MREILRYILERLEPAEPSLAASAKEILDLVVPILTLIFIIWGGVWSYFLFVKTRQRYPSANIKHQVTHRAISEGKFLLRVSVSIQSLGKVLLSLIYAETRIQQVLPLSEKIRNQISNAQDPATEGSLEVQWPLLASRERSWEKGKFEVEPGESDEVSFEFILDSDAQLIVIYTYFQNAKKKGRKRRLGWNVTTLYDFNLPFQTEREMNNLQLQYRDPPQKPQQPPAVKPEHTRQQEQKPRPAPTPTKKP